MVSITRDNIIVSLIKLYRPIERCHFSFYGHCQVY